MLVLRLAEDAINVIAHIGSDFSDSLNVFETWESNFFQIISGNFESQTINSVSYDLLNAGKLLVEVYPERQSSLTTFTECFDLVTWLRKSIKGTELGW